MLRPAIHLCFGAIIALVVWSIVLIIHSGNGTSSKGALLIEDAERDLGDLPVGAHTIAFHVRNTTQQPQRIVGMAEG